MAETHGYRSISTGVATLGAASDGTVETQGSKKSKGRNKREFKCCHECGKVGLGVRSREASMYEASKRSLAETRCVGAGAVLLLARSHKIQVGINSFIFVGSLRKVASPVRR